MLNPAKNKAVHNANLAKPAHERENLYTTLNSTAMTDKPEKIRFGHDHLRALVPLNHISFSAVRDFLEDPRKFRRRWIDLDFSGPVPFAFAEGSAYHAALETYWEAVREGDRNQQAVLGTAREKALQAIRRDGDRIEWGRERIAKANVEAAKAAGRTIETETDKRGATIFYAVRDEDALIEATMKRVEAYVADPPPYKPLAVEASIVAEVTDHETKKPYPLPFKGKLDLVHAGDEILFIDHKLNANEPEPDEETGELRPTPAMILQAAAYDMLAPALLKTLGKEPRRPDAFIFDIFSKSTGRRVPIRFELTERDRIAWARILRGTILQIAMACAVDSPNTAFLPNPFGMLDDGESWREFCTDIDVELGVAERKVKPKKGTIEDAEAYAL